MKRIIKQVSLVLLAALLLLPAGDIFRLLRQPRHRPRYITRRLRMVQARLASLGEPA